MTQPHALIVEDNSKNMQVLVSLLHKQHVTCTEVSDPTQVLNQIDEIDQIDVVFLDLEMPGKNGYDVLDMLKHEPRFANVPVVAYTVHVSEINTAFRLGFHSFIPKPIDPDRFPNQLARILSGERVWDRV